MGIPINNGGNGVSPKIDVQFTTLLGREESMSTIQLDFAAKERFGLSFIDDTGLYLI